jgi:RHS repeat-associated protein
MVRGGVFYRIITDDLGSVRLVVRASTGVVFQRIDYDEFGRITANSAPGFQPFGYAGGLHDELTGLIRFGARDLDSHTGRWTTPDPMLFGGESTNLYSYVGQDPINFVDPSGLSREQRCKSLLNKINNVQKSLDEKLRDMREDRWNLPGKCPGDKEKPGISRRGHQMVINMKKAQLAMLKGWYMAQCGGDPPSGPAPAGAPIFSREYWEQVTGLSGAALAAYLIISEGSRLFPPRNLIVVP